MVCFDFQYENMANENTNDDNNRNERKQNDQFAVPGSSWLICPKCIPESIGRMKSCWSSLRAFWTMAPPARKREKITITFVSEFAIIGNEDFEFTFAVNFTAFFDTFVRLFQVFNVRILENKLRRNTMENPGIMFLLFKNEINIITHSLNFVSCGGISFKIEGINTKCKKNYHKVICLSAKK